ncbi:MAG: hypothetical protein JSR82_17835 [Verrucomicrobia bacterium]|nr:hypothetical protein [Verrucomicrobiota bacterium]
MMHTLRSLALTLLLCLGLAACGGGNKAADAFISDFEKMVVSTEAKANGKPTAADVQALGQQAAELGQKAASMQSSQPWSAEQVKRYTELSQRFSAATTKMVTNAAK